MFTTTDAMSAENSGHGRIHVRNVHFDTLILEDNVVVGSGKPAMAVLLEFIGF